MKKLLLFICLSPFSALAQFPGYVPVPELRHDFYHDIITPDELIEVQKIDYETNKKASFCVRPPEMVDTIVLHHSETPPTATAEYINQLHLNRGSTADPWYMIAYSYVINSPYAGNVMPIPKVSEGRPFSIVGAHAGSNVFLPMDSEQTKIWEDKRILCGKENEEPKFDPTLVKNKKIKANVTTIGIVINGNYSPYNRSSNPGGYRTDHSRYKRNPTLDTQDMIARLSCQIQKTYPRVKYIKYHNYYRNTSCPGNIKNYIKKIQTKAKEYGCEFK